MIFRIPCGKHFIVGVILMKLPVIAIYIMAINSGFFPARGPEGFVFLARAPARA